MMGLDPNEANPEGVTPLMAAAANPNPEIIRYLLIEGADPNARNQAGYTPLILASVYNQNPMVIKALLGAGADPKIADESGRDAMTWAVQNANPAMAKTLSAIAKIPIPPAPAAAQGEGQAPPAAPPQNQ
jgi:ankyrin repeat protein